MVSSYGAHGIHYDLENARDRGQHKLIAEKDAEIERLNAQVSNLTNRMDCINHIAKQLTARLEGRPA